MSSKIGNDIKIQDFNPLDMDSSTYFNSKTVINKAFFQDTGGPYSVFNPKQNCQGYVNRIWSKLVGK